MKRLKRIIFNLLALVLIVTMCLGLTACEDIKRLEVTVMVYSDESGKVEEKKLTVDLYRHLAPETVDHIIDKCVDKNYYDNAIFYQGGETNAIMMGDTVYSQTDEGYSFSQKVSAPLLDGIGKTEFEYGGTKGSNLKVKEGSIALYRTWAENSDYATNAYYGTGRATWLMPTSAISKYDGYLCVFAQIDLEDETNSETWNAIKKLFTDSKYVEYTVYYTGEYDDLSYNCVEKSEYEAPDNLFTPEGDQLVAYKKQNIKVPFIQKDNDSKLAAYVKSVELI